MKKLLLISVASFMTLAGWSQSKINPVGLQKIWQYKVDAGLIQIPGQPLIKKISEEPTVKAVVIVPENTSVSSVLSGLDVEILTDMEGVGVITCPITVIEAIANLPQVQQVGFGDKVSPTMDYARPSGNVTEVQNGFEYSGTTHSFDGSGVVVGMMDIGMQANHLNFLNPDGTTRIQRLWHLNSTNGRYTEYTPSNISSFTTDTPNESHATHVAGIMGGSYSGTGHYTVVTKPNGVSINDVPEGNIPFYGVAPGGDLALAVGQLYGDNIIQGITNIIDYADMVKKPAVVNCSFGTSVGPHDGTGYISAGLSRLGKRAIICISAGNEGSSNLYAYKKLNATGNNRYLRTILTPQTVESAMVDIWTASNTVVPVQLGYVDSDRAFHPLINISQSGQTVSSSSNPNFSAKFNGSVTMTSSVSAANNRFNVIMNIQNLKQLGSAYLAISIGGDGLEGQEIYVYGNNIQLSNRMSESGATLSGFSAGSPGGSISDNACGENLITVGAYMSRTACAVLKKGYWFNSPDLTVGDIASFSSYGKNFQGKQLPIITAPGFEIVSSVSRYYIENGKASIDDMSGEAKNGPNTDYWGQMSGTSMSCPFVTGSVALWLEACPTLNYEQVVEILENTSTYDAALMDDGRWGYGKIDALKGTEYILQKYAANGAVWEDDNQRLVVSFNGSGYDVTMAGEAQFTVTVYDIQGRPVATARGLDGQASVTTSELTPGVYVLAAQGASSRLTRKVTVR